MKEKKNPVVELRNVSVHLGGRAIFKGVNLKVFEEDSIAIVGPSGSGKTVLLKTIGGVFKPSEGHVLIEGEDWQDLQSADKHDLASRLGMLFQRSALFDSMTLLENVAFPLREHTHFSDEEIKKICIDLLKQVNLGENLDRYPYELSGGMQRRLGIARALALSPKIVFYDDPIAGQDPVQGDQMVELILDLKKKFKSTIVTVTSSMEIAYKIANRIFFVVGEEVLDLGSPLQTQENQDPRVQQFIHGRLEGPIDLKML